MKKNMNSFSVRACTVAVQGALLALATLSMAMADDAVTDLTKASSTLEVGVGDVNKDSYKFGEYNGLEKKGAYLIGGFDIRGGSRDENSALRYRVTAKNLGLDTRSLSAEIGDQGKFRLNVGYDQIVHNIDDSFMTPFTGAGTNTLTLPANWATNSRTCGISSTATGNTNLGGASNATVGTAGCGNYMINQNATAGNLTATPVGTPLALTAAEMADFKNVNLSTLRKKSDVGLGVTLSPNWQISASASNEVKDGVQAIGQAYTSPSTGQSFILNPIHYTHNQFNLSLDYKDDKSFASVAYYASFFKDAINGVTVQNPYLSSAVPAVSSTGAISYPSPDWLRTGTNPDNQFHQINLTGGYDISRTTKLVGNVSYGRNTQDEAYIPEGTGIQEVGVEPASSLHGVVVNKTANLKLTAKPIDGLKVLAGYKYDDKDNQTPVNSYNWQWNDTQTSVANATTGNHRYNLPYSKKLQQYNLEGDYTFTKGQAVKLGYENQKLSRWCNGLPATIASCVNVTDLKEDIWRIEYRNNMLDMVTGRIGYTNSDRKASQYGGFGITSSTATAVDRHATDSYTKFMFAARKEDRLRAAIDWQATERLDLTFGYDYTKDDYGVGANPVSNGLPLGLNSTKKDAFNLDANFRVTDKVSVNAFYTRENISQQHVGDGSSTTMAATATSVGALSGLSRWTDDMKDKVDTFGLSFKARELMAGKLDLSGDYVRSHSKSPYDALASGGVNAYAATPLATANNGTVSILNQVGGGQSLTGIYSDSDTIKLGAKYAIDKTSALRFGLTWQKLASGDPARYVALQPGTSSAVTAGSTTAKVNGVAVPVGSVYTYNPLMPTYEQSPSYTVNTVSVSYVYSFK